MIGRWLAVKRPGLRTRIIAGFAVGALVLSSVMAVLSYQLTEGFLLRQREASAIRVTSSSAAVVRAGLASDVDADIGALLRTLDIGATRRPAVWHRGNWYLRSADNGITTSIPSGLRQEVQAGHITVQRVRTDNGPALVIGVPVDAQTAFYIVDSMNELDRSLRVLALVLILVGAVTTIAGALLGRYAARYVLRPLSKVVAAARNITSGDVSIRLDPAAEPELAHLTTSFNEMVDQLSARMERDRRFAADVSHELRSPLQTLAAAASVVAKRKDQLDERTAMAVDLLTEEVDRFQALVTDLITLARSDQPPERTEVNMLELVRDVCRHHQLADTPITADDLPIWRVDRRRFEQAVGNLLDNAQRHGGGPTLVHIGHEEGVRYLTVEDDGPGVPAADRDAIFHRFVRGRTAHARGGGDGTGLGLALVWQHVTAHGGSVTVTGRHGGGARFRIELPEQT